jgi:hypothetical protein
MAYIVTLQNVDLSSWDTLYMYFKKLKLSLQLTN